MGPIVLGQLSALTTEPCSRCTAAEQLFYGRINGQLKARPCVGALIFFGSDRLMKKSLYAERISGTARYDLPPLLSREIGRIIVHWAHFEHLVQDMVWQSIPVSQAVGRTAIREPRVTDRLELLRDLIKLRDAQWDDELFKSILNRANLIVARRDLLAHGIWGNHSGGMMNMNDIWHVQLARGSWPKNISELVEGSKKIMPEMVPMELSKLRATTREIVQLIGDLKKLRSSAVA
jgi:hypothetical protein